MTSPKSNPSVHQDTKKVFDALRGLRFGSVEITVHEGRIVQVERKEKVRLNLSLQDLQNDLNGTESAP
jgi:hypothetical protein